MSAQEFCAWCLEAAGQTPEEGESHGICEGHAEQMLIEFHWNRLQNTPSYVETQAALFAAEKNVKSQS